MKASIEACCVEHPVINLLSGPTFNCIKVLLAILQSILKQPQTFSLREPSKIHVFRVKLQNHTVKKRSKSKKSHKKLSQ